MKNEDILFWAAAAGSVVLIVVLIMQQKQNKPTPPPPPGSTPGSTGSSTAGAGSTAGSASQPSSTATTTTLDKNKELFKGVQSNAEVKELQRQLNQLHPHGLVIDGQFGELTNTALIQETNGLNRITLNQFAAMFGVTIPNNGSTSQPPATTNDTWIDTRSVAEKAAEAKAGDGWYFIGGYFNPFNYWGWAYDAVTGS
jgi:hypothetical protein